MSDQGHVHLPSPIATPASTSASIGLLQRKCACGGAAGMSGECSACRAKPGRLQRRPASGDALGLMSAPPIVHEVVRSPGQPLDQATRMGLEARFGHSFGLVPVHHRAPALSRSGLAIGPADDESERQADRVADRLASAPAGHARSRSPGGQRVDLSRVRIHADSRAAESARAVNAVAYTVGEHVVFGAGQYAPGTAAGQRLLSHELTHVVQQTEPGGPGTGLVQRQLGEDLNLAAQQGVPSQKWSPELEAQYRRQGQETAANAIRNCRTMGGAACNLLVTVDELTAAYAGYVAQKSGGSGQSGQGGGGTHATPLVAGGLGLQPFQPPTAPRIPPSLLRPPVTPPVTAPPTVLPGVGAAETAVTGTTAAETATGIGATATTVVPIVIIAALLAVEIYTLLKLSEFQQELIKRGYIILEAPLAVCIRGCHTSSPRTSFGTSPFPRLRAPGSSTQISPEDLEALREFLKPKGQTGTTVGPGPGTQTQPTEEKRRRDRLARYPVFWPAILPPPLTNRFNRVRGAGRDPDLAEALLGAKWARARREDLRGQSLVPHHVLPLFLGGPDTPSNVIFWNAELHRRGHPCLQIQPQMLTPPPPLPPLPPDLYTHPDGTPYVLAGFKECPLPEAARKPAKP